MTTFGALIERFIVEERIRGSQKGNRMIGVAEGDEEFDPEALDFSTASAYFLMLDVHIRPK